jgi:hypothetical protein
VSDLYVRRVDLGPLEPLGSGGTARIYRAPHYRGAGFEVVYKEYNKKTLTAAGARLGPGLHAVAELRQELADKQRQFFDNRTIWPLRVIVDDEGVSRRTVGTIMRLIPDRFFQIVQYPSGSVESTPREIHYLFNEDSYARRLGLAIVPIEARIALCGQIARSLALLHGARIVFGDLSARNVVYDPTAALAPDVLMLDCDSARVRGTASAFGSQPHTPNWEPPEALRAKRRLAAMKGSGDTYRMHELRHQVMIQSRQTDVYKFALVVIRILDYGPGRSPNKDPAKALSILHRVTSRHVAEVLVASLSAAPDDRPSMVDWYEAFTGRKRRPRSEPGAGQATASQSGDKTSRGFVLVDGEWRRRPGA